MYDWCKRELNGRKFSWTTFSCAQIGFKNMENVEQLPLTLEKAVQLVKDVFISAAERDVYTGDALKICIITKEGIREELVPLRKDWDVFSAMPKLACFCFSPVESFTLLFFLYSFSRINTLTVSVLSFVCLLIQCFVSLRTTFMGNCKNFFIETSCLHIDSANGKGLELTHSLEQLISICYGFLSACFLWYSAVTHSHYLSKILTILQSSNASSALSLYYFFLL